MSAGSDDDSAEERDRKDDDTAGMSQSAKVWVEMGPYLGIGWMLAVSLGVFALLGWWLDGKFGTNSVFTVIGSLLGITVGFANFFKVVMSLEKRKKNKR